MIGSCDDVYSLSHHSTYTAENFMFMDEGEKTIN